MEEAREYTAVTGMGMIYHFMTKSDLARDLTEDSLREPSLESEGFIHCSTLEHVINVANFLAPFDEQMQLLEIDEQLVAAPIKYENLEGGERLFPHVYGPIDRRAIVGYYALEWDGEDGYRLPDKLRT